MRPRENQRKLSFFLILKMCRQINQEAVCGVLFQAFTKIISHCIECNAVVCVWTVLRFLCFSPHLSHNTSHFEHSRGQILGHDSWTVELSVSLLQVVNCWYIQLYVTSDVAVSCCFIQGGTCVGAVLGRFFRIRRIQRCYCTWKRISFCCCCVGSGRVTTATARWRMGSEVLSIFTHL